MHESSKDNVGHLVLVFAGEDDLTHRRAEDNPGDLAPTVICFSEVVNHASGEQHSTCLRLNPSSTTY